MCRKSNISFLTKSEIILTCQGDGHCQAQLYIFYVQPKIPRYIFSLTCFLNINFCTLGVVISDSGQRLIWTAVRQSPPLCSVESSADSRFPWISVGPTFLKSSSAGLLTGYQVSVIRSKRFPVTLVPHLYLKAALWFRSASIEAVRLFLGGCFCTLHLQLPSAAHPRYTVGGRPQRCPDEGPPLTAYR